MTNIKQLPNIQPIITTSNRGIAVNKNKKHNDFIVKALVDKLKTSVNDREMIGTLIEFSHEANLNKLNTGMYNLGDYYILSGYKNENFEIYKSNIDFLNKNDFCKTSAPMLKEFISSKDGKYCAMVLKVDNSNGILLEYRSDLATDDAKRVFVREMVDLLNAEGIYNPYVFESYDSWKLLDNGSIYIDRWGVFKKCKNDEERQGVKDKLSSMCGMIYH